MRNPSSSDVNERILAAVQILRQKLPPLEPASSENDSQPEATPIDPEPLPELTNNQPSDRKRSGAPWWKPLLHSKVAASFATALLIAAVAGTIPSKIQIRRTSSDHLNRIPQRVQRVIQEHWKNLNQSISDRAAIAYEDDFRTGLDAWQSRSNLTRSWSYDAAGFIQPGPLAVFKPTVDLTDYRFEFLGEIDRKAMGWAFRAQDLNNYYAMKLTVVKPGPLPVVHMVRYAVINGKEGRRVDRPLPITVRPDMLYRIQVDARGSDFTVTAQGQVIDFWSDSRLKHGGVGFFCNRGERARLRWVEVSHQYDTLGKLCAFLAPYGIEGRNGSIN